MLALSTAWFLGSNHPLEALFALAVSQGFKAFELNHAVHPLDVERMLRLMKQFDFTVVSLHNVCSPLREPLEPDDRYGDNLASLNEAERRQSVMHLRSTAETALRLGARAVVIHAGSVPEAKNDPEYARLRRAYAAGEVESETVFREMRARFQRRRELGRPHRARLVRSLGEVCADYPTLQFGLENRYHYYSLPDVEELAQVLEELDLENVGYWHDCGHAQVQENLGLCRHEEWLQRYGDRLVGVHLHGMGDPIHDHFAPAPDNMPFEMVARYLPPDVPHVLELGAFNDFERVVAGRDYLEALFASVRAEVAHRA